jgi:DNA segregation ATPase FtsK/SpoIIIE, S-DNA-T family
VGKKKKKGGGFRLPIPKLSIELPERAKRMVLSIGMIVLALIFVFAFFDKAGNAGGFFFHGAQFLVGRVVFVLPIFFAAIGVVLWGMKKYSALPVFLSLILLIGSASGILGVLARARGQDIAEMAGIIGTFLSFPAFSAFGFWVGEIIFFALLAVGTVILWQLLPHEQGEKSAFASEASEKLKKIFEPKFQVSKVEPEEKAQVSTIFSKDDEEEDEEEEEKDSKKKKKEKKENTIEASPVVGELKPPPLDLLEAEKGMPNAGDVKAYAAIIKKTLQNFDIPVEVSEVNVGPAVTQYAFKPAEGVKLSRITALQNDLALALAAHPLRIEAPIPGRALVGIEIPNKTRSVVRLRSLLEHSDFQNSNASLALALGKDVSGAPIYADLARMPHLLVAGATGSGKTIGLTNIILSLIYTNGPSRLRFILVDPKRVEFPVYNDLPHLLTPVIFDTQQTLNALKWLIKEMERRFAVFSEVRVRDIKGYHAYYADKEKKGKAEEAEDIPYIVTVIDELADLMATRGKELEGMIVRLAQMARAVGIHLVLATQRPSVEVITGLIKANVTSRAAFQVASQIDSRTILDSAGAEKLLGQGDMLFVSAEFTKPRRIQGAYVTEKEVKKIVEWIVSETEDVGREDMSQNDLAQSAIEALEGGDNDTDEPLYEEAKRVVVESKKASASLLQRRLKVGYARAARLLDILEEKGVVGPAEGSRPREVFATRGRGGEDGEENEKWINP